MEVRKIGNKGEIYDFLSRSPELQLYLIGDLDDFYWPHTEWFAAYDLGRIQAVALLYKGMNTPSLLLYSDGDLFFHSELLQSIKNNLPEEFNVHLSPGLIDVLGKEKILKDYGHSYRMILSRSPVAVIKDNNIRRLNADDLAMMRELYEISYRENWFDGRMVETGKYFGYFNGDRLTGIAGVHVCSKEYRIAALGNIATHPDYRGRKIGYMLTTVLCSDLKNDVDIIGLNVKSDNQAAIKCYTNAGFEIRSSYNEFLIRNIQ
jgi:ribosomal protein S18 acetylase RimI-like enzyme